MFYTLLGGFHVPRSSVLTLFDTLYVACPLQLARRKKSYSKCTRFHVHMRPPRQFVDSLPGIALPNCLMLGTSNPPGVPRCAEFSMLLRGWSCVLGFAGWCRVQQRQAIKSVGMTRVPCMLIKLMLFLRIRVKSYFREKLAWKRSSFSRSDELGFSKH